MSTNTYSKRAKKFFTTLFTFKTLKKSPYYFITVTLTLGASLILGLLSFGGMMALLPLLPLGIVAFALAVAYEGEIYSKNIQDALKRINFPKYLQRTLANGLLLETVLNIDKIKDCPLFFKDYKACIEDLKRSQDLLDSALSQEKKNVKKQIKRLEAQLKNMEKFFAAQVFSSQHLLDTPYQQEIALWLVKNKIDSLYRTRKLQFLLTAGFALISGAFMAWGTTFMLSGAFAAIPLLAGAVAAPYIIIPLALIAGVAWSFLVYSSVTDIIINKTAVKFFENIKEFLSKNSELLLFVAGLLTVPYIIIPATFVAVIIWKTLENQQNKAAVDDKEAKKWDESTKKKWYEALNQRFTKQLSLRNLLTFFFGTTIIGLTLVLSGFIAATMYATGNEPMTIMTIFSGTFQYVTSILMAITIGISELFFAFQNTNDTVKDLSHRLQHFNTNTFIKIGNRLLKSWEKLYAKENLLQIINPARIIIKITLAPLKFILFIGHLVSIGAAGDKVPAVPSLVSAILGFFGELGVDWHYFLGGDHHHHANSVESIMTERLTPANPHEHGNDLPTRFLRLVLLPIYLIATIWDYSASWLGYGIACLAGRENPVDPLTLKDAYKRQTGGQEKHHHHHHHHHHHSHAEDKEAAQDSSDTLFANPKKDSEPQPISSQWIFEGLRFRVERFQNAYHPSKDDKKSQALDNFRKTVLLLQKSGSAPEAINLEAEANKPVYAKQQFFSTKATTRTEDFMDRLLENYSC